jgi:FkbM family methyltransferase
MLLYTVAEDKETILRAFYWFRGFPHGYLKGELRIAIYRGLRIVFPFKDDPAFDDVWLREVYQEYIPKREHVVVDIGAHMGFFTLKIVNSVKKVLSVEPDPVSLKFLRYNLLLNGVEDKVLLCAFALGGKKGRVFLDRGAYSDHRRTKTTFEKTDYPAEMRTLDSLVEENLLDSVDLIKIDTEGFELNILEGSVKTLKNFKPDLMIAAYHFPNEHLLVSKFLIKHGYAVSLYYMPLFLSPAKEIYLYASRRA